MANEFFSKPILNSPYEYPSRHCELDDKGQPTQQLIEHRRRAEFITPIPKPNDWLVAPETARLLQHWRHHPFNGVRPFFCQIETHHCYREQPVLNEDEGPNRNDDSRKRRGYESYS